MNIGYGGDNGAGHESKWPSYHDPLCMPGLKGNDSSMCPWCITIRKARREERQHIAHMLDDLTAQLRGETPMPDA